MPRVLVAAACTALPLPALAQTAIYPDSGRTFLLTPERASWRDAKDYAASVGGRLACIERGADQQWVAGMFGDAADQLWIGYSDELSEGAWVWETGSTSPFTAWAPGEPNDFPSSPTGEDYAVIDNRQSGLWVDYPSPTYGTTPVLFFGLVETCAANLNLDALIDFSDYLEFLTLFDAGDTRVDFNGDGLVDFSDYLLFVNYYGNSCDEL